MKQIFLLAFFLTSCFHFSRDEVVQELSLPKQRQKIALLEKRLVLAQKQEEKVHHQVDQLGEALQAAHLALIRKQMEGWEKQVASRKFECPAEISCLFDAERQRLHEIIQNGPSANSFEAQKVLNRLLELITKIGDGA